MSIKEEKMPINCVDNGWLSCHLCNNRVGFIDRPEQPGPLQFTCTACLGLATKRTCILCRARVDAGSWQYRPFGRKDLLVCNTCIEACGV